MLSRVHLFATPWTVTRQPPLSMGFPRQRILEGVAISFSRGSSQPGDGICISCSGRQILYRWTTMKALATLRIWILSCICGSRWGNSVTLCSKRINLRTVGGSEPEGRLETGAEEKQNPMTSCCWITWRHRDSWPPEEKNSIRGQRRGLIAQSFCVIKFY